MPLASVTSHFLNGWGQGGGGPTRRPRKAAPAIVRRPGTPPKLGSTIRRLDATITATGVVRGNSTAARLPRLESHPLLAAGTATVAASARIDQAAGVVRTDNAPRHLAARAQAELGYRYRPVRALVVASVARGILKPTAQFIENEDEELLLLLAATQEDN